MAVTPLLDLRSAAHPGEISHVPANVEAEHALLGAVLYDNAAIERVDDGLHAEHFFEPFHQRLWDAMSATIRDGKIDPKLFVAASLDEADVLRSYGSKTFQEFLPAFEPVRFKFVATATPSPNRFKELIHYAGFLGVMDTGQALTRFFQRNSEKANDLTLYPHKEEEFWLWVSTWAVFLQKPSDLGFSDDGYGSELNEQYFRDSLRYLAAAEFEIRQPTLFDVLDAGRNIAEAA